MTEIKRGKVQIGDKYGKKITIKDSYQNFIKKEEIKVKDYMDIIQEFSKQFMISLLEGNIITMPHMMGKFYIVRRKLKNSDMRANWNVSINEGEVIPHVNLHSDEYIARLHWCKLDAHFTNMTFWQFDLTKDNKSRNDISITKHIFNHGTNNFHEFVHRKGNLFKPNPDEI